MRLLMNECSFRHRWEEQLKTNRSVWTIDTLLGTDLFHACACRYIPSLAGDIVGIERERGDNRDETSKWLDSSIASRKGQIKENGVLSVPIGQRHQFELFMVLIDKKSQKKASLSHKTHNQWIFSFQCNVTKEKKKKTRPSLSEKVIDKTK